MPEPEELSLSPTSIPAEPQGGTRTSEARPSVDRGQPEKVSPWTHLELPVLAALGATFGFLTGMGLWNEIHSRSVDFALWAICLGLAAYVLFDPAMEALYSWLGATRPEFPEGRKKAATAIAALATLMVSAFHHSLDISFEPEVGKLSMGLETINGWGLALLVFFSIGVAAALVAHWWSRGARRQPPRAAHYGGLASAVAGIFVVGSVLAYLAAKNRLNSPYWIAGIGLLGLLWFVGPGILGGWAINKQREQKEGGPSATRNIVAHLILFSVGYVFLLLAVARALEAGMPNFKGTIESYVWLPIAALLGQNLGWALAPFFRAQSCDRVLGVSGVIAAAVAQQDQANSSQGLSGVLEMPLREGSPTLGVAPAVSASILGAGAAAVATTAASASKLPQSSVAQPSVERAGSMLLKPRGDRLWATLGLLVSLASSAFAYHMGTLRKDPDITYNVQEYLVQDSGLRRDNLAVHSNGRVVTLTGRVDDEIEHREAVQKALSVRGVRQLIDQIQVAPPPTLPLTPVAGEPAATELAPGAALTGAPADAATSGVSTNISIGNSPGRPSAAKPSEAKASNAAKANAAPEGNTHAAAKAALPKSSGAAESTSSLKQTVKSATSNEAETGSPETADTKKSKNPFSIIKNKIKKPKTNKSNN